MLWHHHHHYQDLAKFLLKWPGDDSTGKISVKPLLLGENQASHDLLYSNHAATVLDIIVATVMEVESETGEYQYFYIPWTWNRLLFVKYKQEGVGTQGSSIFLIIWFVNQVYFERKLCLLLKRK